VDSKEDGALIRVTGCNDTDEKQNWAYTLKGQVMVGWIKIDLHLSESVRKKKILCQLLFSLE